jgi:hypothetical protein
MIREPQGGWGAAKSRRSASSSPRSRADHLHRRLDDRPGGARATVFSWSRRRSRRRVPVPVPVPAPADARGRGDLPHRDLGGPEHGAVRQGRQRLPMEPALADVRGLRGPRAAGWRPLRRRPRDAAGHSAWRRWRSQNPESGCSPGGVVRAGRRVGSGWRPRSACRNDVRRVCKRVRLDGSPGRGRG